MGVAKAFSLKGCFIFVGPTKLQGFADGDAITMEEVTKFETLTGADGDSVYCFNPNADRAATIRLLQRSSAYRELMIQAQAQWALASIGTPLTPIPFLYTDPFTGTVVTAGLIFMNEPQISVGQQPGPIEIKASLVGPQVVYGMLNII
jgi:hypothetical protein